ncbi:MAG: TetM/TetW/TetO/TetS family tetracycline resistance ribosomal protection protein, partial [Clostridia bacterium]|nr:TetM/TetW/TetO/TetS family tetracycline resistance ribosomal protection protein [Clostridia bacterium]
RVMGRIQLEILKELVAERFGMNIEFGPCRILYKETVAAPVMGYGHYEPLRHYAEAHLRIEPAERNSGISVANECSLEMLDSNFRNLILSHIKEKTHLGILTGSPLTDVKITLTAGRSHLKHTEGGDFREATYRAIRQGLEKAENVLLEPYYGFVLRVPADCVGRAVADIQRLSGEFEAPEIILDEAVIKGEGPAYEFLAYPEEVIAYTKGRGVVSFSDRGYRPCHNPQQVIEEIGYEKDRDLENPSSSVFCAHGGGFEVKWQDVDAMRHIK